MSRAAVIGVPSEGRVRVMVKTRTVAPPIALRPKEGADMKDIYSPGDVLSMWANRWEVYLADLRTQVVDTFRFNSQVGCWSYNVQLCNGEGGAPFVSAQLLTGLSSTGLDILGPQRLYWPIRVTYMDYRTMIAKTPEEAAEQLNAWFDQQTESVRRAVGQRRENYAQAQAEGRIP